MKSHIFISHLILSFSILITLFNNTHAKETNSSQILEIDQLLTPNHQSSETQFKLSTNIVLAGVLCFIASSISSAGGIGGGGLFIPILTIVAGLDLKTASTFSAFMVTGGSIANVLCNFCSTNNLIDYDIAMLSEPFVLLGVSIGVICNLVFPEWLITVLFAVFLAWSTFKTCKSGVMYWNLESDLVELRRNGFLELENGSVRFEGDDKSIKEVEKNSKFDVPLKKIGILFLVWCSFSLIYLLRHNRPWQSSTLITVCGVGYWVLSSFQIPLAVIFTAWMLIHTKTTLQVQASTQQVTKSEHCQYQLNLFA